MSDKLCRVCNAALVAENCYLPNLDRGIYICRSCEREERRVRRQAEPEKHRQRNRLWRSLNSERKKQTDAVWRAQNRAGLRTKANTYYQTNKHEIALKRKQWALALKIEVLGHYSGGELRCVRCGFTDLRALSIDHVRGGGSRHRRELKGGGLRVYGWLKAKHYPDGFQTLCLNCQAIKRMEEGEVGCYENGQEAVEVAESTELV